jgi:hypothetical protein
VQITDVLERDDGPTNSASDLRRFPRHILHQPLVGIPILPDGSPDWEHRRSGRSVNLSLGGMGVEFDCADGWNAGEMVVVIQGPASPLGCAGLEIRHTRRIASGGLEIGGQFGGLAQEILRSENLIPTFHAPSLQFSPGLPADMLERWEQIGVLSSYVYDRVQLCPECRGLPTFRQGCPRCGAARLTNERLIHHFACAHVGAMADFEADDELVCPKCRTRRLVVGADYEYMKGPYHCLECHWSDMELEPVGQCIRCGFRFPGYQAHVEELRAYRANQLDILAILPTSRSAHRVPAGPAPDRRPALCAE